VSQVTNITDWMKVRSKIIKSDQPATTDPDNVSKAEQHWMFLLPSILPWYLYQTLASALHWQYSVTTMMKCRKDLEQWSLPHYLASFYWPLRWWRHSETSATSDRKSIDQNYLSELKTIFWLHLANSAFNILSFLLSFYSLYSSPGL